MKKQDVSKESSSDRLLRVRQESSREVFYSPLGIEAVLAANELSKYEDRSVEEFEMDSEAERIPSTRRFFLVNVSVLGANLIVAALAYWWGNK